MQKIRKKSRRVFWMGIIGCILLAICAAFLPPLVTTQSWVALKVDQPNEIGDTVGGIMGPVVGLIGAALTFLAFWAQYDANLEQRRQFIETLRSQNQADRDSRKRYEDDRLMEQEWRMTNAAHMEQQARQSRLDIFETRFNTMLTIHRDNVKNTDLSLINGRAVFQHMFDELKYTYWKLRSHIEGNPQYEGFTDEHIFQVSYLTFFFGVGTKSTPLIRNLLGDQLADSVDKIHGFMQSLRYGKTPDKNVTEKQRMVEVNTENGVFQWRRYHGWGVGHLRRYSHYIRHLFQIIKFVDEQADDFLSYEEKYKYLSILRAQLSTNEQLLIYYNALSVLGQPWITSSGGKVDGGYLVKYCLVKSLPLHSADFHKKPADFFPNNNDHGKPVFEWTEIKARLSAMLTQSC